MCEKLGNNAKAKQKEPHNVSVVEATSNASKDGNDNSVSNENWHSRKDNPFSWTDSNRKEQVWSDFTMRMNELVSCQSGWLWFLVQSKPIEYDSRRLICTDWSI